MEKCLLLYDLSSEPACGPIERECSDGTVPLFLDLFSHSLLGHLLSTNYRLWDHNPALPHSSAIFLCFIIVRIPPKFGEISSLPLTDC